MIHFSVGAQVAIFMLMLIAIPFILVAVMKVIIVVLKAIVSYLEAVVYYGRQTDQDKWRDLIDAAWKARKGRPPI